MSGLWLGGVTFLGPGRESASIALRPGVNVICGASETGKSFIVEVIDFMLGSQQPLRDIPERAGFDRIRMPVVCAGWPTLGLERSAEGGNFSVYDEVLLEDTPTTKRRMLRQQHSASREDTLSHALLERIGLTSKRIRRNRKGETSSLSFRNLARLCVVTEEEIQRVGSPLLSGQFTQKTSEYAVFKLLVTGTDDSALVSTNEGGARRQSIEGKVELLGEMIGELEGEIGEEGLDRAELQQQLQTLEGDIGQQNEALGEVQARLDEILRRRASVAGEIRKRRERMAEIDELSLRFDLLGRHYQSDLNRLEAIHESGSMFVHLKRNTCPLCGAEPEHQHLESDCDGNTEGVVEAADAEMEKVRQLDRELSETVTVLQAEREQIDSELPVLQEQYDELNSRVSEVAAPAVTSQRASYNELVLKRVEVLQSVQKISQLEKLERQRRELEEADERDTGTQESRTEVGSSTLDAFAQRVQRILSGWHYPNAERVFFDEIEKEFQIDGKRRGSTGKGLRAITHAAVNIGLLEFCLDEGLPHPGFVVLDSPLLAYWEPEGDDDDLTGTDLKERFYEYLLGMNSDLQVIVVENQRPPAFVSEQSNVVVFTKNPYQGRYGFFAV